MRAEELADARAWVEAWRPRAYGEEDPLAVGAVLRLRAHDDESERICALASVAGGTKLEVGGVTVWVLTPSSPLGRAIVGQREGDEVHPRGGRARVYDIEDVS